MNDQSEANSQRAALRAENGEQRESIDEKHYNFVADTFSAWALRQPDEVALYWVSASGNGYKRTYAQLLDDAEKAASVLSGLGVKRHDTAILVLSREQRWWELILGCLRLGVVVSPGSIQLKAKDIAHRIVAADAAIIITNDGCRYEVEKAVEQTEWSGPLVTTGAPVSDRWNGYESLRANPGARPAPVRTGRDEAALCYFTSGTTGNPKMTVHSHEYPLGHEATGAEWLQLTPGDLVWNLSDNGWAKAAWSSLFGPWMVGAGVFTIHNDRFDIDQVLDALERFPVKTMCAPPTVYRFLVQKEISSRKFSALSHCVSAGEPLNPEVFNDWKQQTNMVIHEGYGQTETVLLCGNFRGKEIRAGSMGTPASNFNLQVIDANGHVAPVGEEGDMAVAIPSGERPVGMFLGYKDDAERTKNAFRGDWYLTGDRATRDSDGYFWFVGRSDDVIITSGYRIGPFEIESVLIEHDAVVESAVVSSPDPERGEVVKAFIILADSYLPTDELIEELQRFVKTSTAPYKFPRKIEFVSELPKTTSGKIRRKELKEREWKNANR